MFKDKFALPMAFATIAFACAPVVMATDMTLMESQIKPPVLTVKATGYANDANQATGMAMQQAEQTCSTVGGMKNGIAKIQQQSYNGVYVNGVDIECQLR